MSQPNPYLPIGATERDIERQYAEIPEAEIQDAEAKAADRVAHDLICGEKEKTYGLLDEFAGHDHRMQAILRLAFAAASWPDYLPSNYYTTGLHEDIRLAGKVIDDHESDIAERILRGEV